MPKVTVLGGGSFGTVLSNIAAENANSVHFWMRDAEQVASIQKTRINAKYLPGYQLDRNIVPTIDLKAAVVDSQLVIIVIPSAGYKDFLLQLIPFIQPDTLLVSATKGLDVSSFKTMSQLLQASLTQHQCVNEIGILSGPNLAKEIATKQFTASVIATQSDAVFQLTSKTLRTDYFRLYDNTDVVGVELCGALKNIYAIAAGLIDAMQMGDNSKSMLLTRSLAEMSRFCVPLGADPMTFLGLAGMGDLMVTCMSSLSRNYRVGYAIGEGKTLADILADLGQVAEGINTIRAVHKQAQLTQIDMPLLSGLYAIIFDNQSLETFIDALMQAEHKNDVDYSFTVV